MREIALRDQGMREVKRISEVSLWDQGAREVSLSDEATVKFDSQIQKDVNRKKRNVDKMVWPTLFEDWPPLPCMQSQSSVYTEGHCTLAASNGSCIVSADRLITVQNI